ncbi:cupin domain protein [Collimonas arenae]|uniref:Cupin domain protein n=1 Tax=Collimonas arenae TaxID=279058 RepID=A0A127PJZ0_9BURK|nr:cupin domain-containing protein [Collimonas arenae]AMO98053.1 cupin domain protein [Collimonas arenae]AMP07915.1 cupin domain protein [Collimonas arenae]
MKAYLSISILLAGILSAHFAMAADMAPAAKATQVLQRIRVQGTEREMGMGIAEFAPNAEKPRHKAIGPEIVYVLEGEITVLVDGAPAKVVHAGGSYQLAAKDVHVTKAGPAGAKTIASWVTVPGKQFNVFVPR